MRAALDLGIPAARESCGLHEYDGVVVDLSGESVARAVARLGQGPDPADDHDAAHLRATEDGLRAAFGRVRVHETNPLVHIEALDVSCYERDYAPEAERKEARRRHIASWPDAVDVAVSTLTRVPAPTAAALLPAARGLGFGLREEAPLRALDRFVGHVQACARDGDPDPGIGGDALALLYGAPEALPVDLAALRRNADAERDRLTDLLKQSCAPVDGDFATAVKALLSDHPATPEEIYSEAREQVEEATRFAVEHGIVPEPGGQLHVGPAPPSRSWATAMMSWSGPYERDTASSYWVTPPDAHWPAADREDWLAVFSRTTLPVITVHEVTPGHYAHGRFLRVAAGEIRRTLHSGAFVEGWAHDMEEVMLEEGFRAGDPRYAVGVALEGLVRVERLTASVGLHTGELTLAEVTDRFRRNAFLGGPAARSEAVRATFDPTYGRYTWGKLCLRDLRAQARVAWGAGFSLARLHRALLALGAPPLGLLSTALAAGSGGNGGPVPRMIG